MCTKSHINDQFDQDECKELLEIIKNNADQALVNTKNNGGIKPGAANYVSYLNKYIDFKESFSEQPANAQSTNDEVKAESNYCSKAFIQKYSKNLLKSRNIIFHGAPGTGKTYLAKQIAAHIVSNGEFQDYEKLSPEQKSHIGFVQFHPSYDYSDFVEGLKPVVNENGEGMTFQLRDGIFKSFVKRTDDIDKVVNDFLAKCINEQTEFKTKQSQTAFYICSFNSNSIVISRNKDIESEDGRTYLKISHLKLLLSSKEFISSRKDSLEYVIKNGDKWAFSSYLYPIYEAIYQIYKESEVDLEKDSVFIIDEINRGEISKIFGELFFSIDPGYRGEAGAVLTQYSYLHDNPDEKFYIPENVYIIGTMNDIDRSVDSFDFAMRRRFRFINITAEERADDMFKSLDGENRDAVKNRMTNLNNAIAETHDLNENYQIGPAYFLKLEELGYDKNGFDSLWMDYLEPLLQDYVMGMSDADVLMKKFNDAYKNDKPKQEKSTNGTNQTAGADGETESEVTVNESDADSTPDDKQ